MEERKGSRRGRRRGEGIGGNMWHCTLSQGWFGLLTNQCKLLIITCA